MTNVLRRKAAEAASLSRMGTAILRGNKLNVQWIPEGSDHLGYTSESKGREKTVFVAWHHPQFFNDLSEDECRALRMGIFAHETLHQCLTNFEYTQIMAKKMSQAEAAIFMQFCNTLEDPAIEYFAPSIFGGVLLDSLRFSIRTIYKKSPGIDRSRNPFEQLINALIQFGDMGIIKGSFTFPEAYEYFKIIAPLYNEGITCPNSMRRIDIAKECMEKSRPLWEQIVKDREEMERLLDELLKALERRGLHLLRDKEETLKGDEETGKEERQSAILASINPKSDDTQDEQDEDTEHPGSPASESDTDEQPVDGDEDSIPMADGSSSDKDQEDGADSSTPGKAISLSGESTDDGGQGGSDGEESKGTGGDPSYSDGSEITTDEETADEMTDEVFEISDDLYERIAQTIEAEEKKIAEQERREGGDKPSNGDLPDFPISSSAFKHASCKNIWVAGYSGAVSSLYREEVAKNTYEIKNLTKGLDRIFKSDQEENSRMTSGSYNIKRGSIGTTARMFDKRREPGNLKDAAIVLAVDLSGSMCGSKIAQARKAAIVFAEALTKLGIPYYIMGFSADRGADAVHHHYVTWNNSKRERESLVTMEANGNNFDGYSIRYASELLRAQSASNKILFVISDGEPACSTYHGYEAGIGDTINAIKDARKVGTVFGIAIGYGCEPTVLQGMYGKDFIHVDEKNLSNMLCKKLEKIFRSKK